MKRSLVTGLGIARPSLRRCRRRRPICRGVRCRTRHRPIWPCLQLDRLLPRSQRRRRLGQLGLERLCRRATARRAACSAATVGYNWQAVGSPWVFGLEGDIDWTSINDSVSCARSATNCETKNDWFGTVRGRVGYAWDRFMPLRHRRRRVRQHRRQRDRLRPAPATPMPAGPSALALRARSSATGPPRSSISMRISATRPAALPPAASRPTSIFGSTFCAGA